MDLSKIKVGDEVCSCFRGWGEVQKLFSQRFTVNFKHNRELSYYYTGKYYSTDINPEITDWRPKKREEWKPQLHLVKPHGMKTIRACKTLAAYVAEFAPDWQADWEDEKQKKWSVWYDYADIVYDSVSYNDCCWLKSYETTVKAPGVVYMPKEIAYQLCEDLNNGVVEL